MKRTNVVLNEKLLSEVTRIFAVKTYSEAINKSLEEVVRISRMNGILKFVGSGVWEGDLSDMREDKKIVHNKKRK